MPRHATPGALVDRLDRASLSRDSAGKGSLGRHSYTDVQSVGSAATRHWVNSVSDIYGPDEIEELLDDLNRLELAAIEQEDFDINGSQLGGRKRGGGGRSRRGCHGGASPTFSVRSWDSHAVYQHYPNKEEEEGVEEDEMGALTGAASGGDLGEGGGRNGGYPVRSKKLILCYCDTSYLTTSGSLLRVFLLISSVACLCTILAAGTATVGLFALPHFPKMRIMMFICIFTILFTTFVMFLNISHTNVLMPFDLGRMQTVVYLALTIAFLTMSVLLLQVHREDANHSPPVSFWTRYHLLFAAILGFSCSFATFLCIFNCGRTKPSDQVLLLQESSTHFTLHETVTSSAAGIAARGGARPDPPTAAVENLPMKIQNSQKTDIVDSTATTSGRKANRSLANENYEAPKPAPAAAAAAAAAAKAKHNHSNELPPQGGPPKPSAPPPSPPQAPKSKKDGQTSQKHVQASSVAKRQTAQPVITATPSSQKNPLSRSSSSSASSSSSSSSSSSYSVDSVPNAMAVAAKKEFQQQKLDPLSSSAAVARLKTKALVSAETTLPPPPQQQQQPLSTGAIPKKKKPRPPPLTLPPSDGGQQQPAKPSTNHLDEIIAVPLDDPSPQIQQSRRKHYVH